MLGVTAPVGAAGKVMASYVSGKLDVAGDDYKVGLVLKGMPVRLHKQAISAHAHDIVDEIPAAA